MVEECFRNDKYSPCHRGQIRWRFGQLPSFLNVALNNKPRLILLGEKKIIDI